MLFPCNLMSKKAINHPDFTLDPRSCIFRQVSTDFPLSFLAFGEENEGEGHHRLSLSIESAVDSDKEEKKRNEGNAPKSEISSSLTNDKTNNGAARLVLEHASRYVEAETERRGNLSALLSRIVLRGKAPTTTVGERKSEKFSRAEKLIFSRPSAADPLALAFVASSSAKRFPLFLPLLSPLYRT